MADWLLFREHGMTPQERSDLADALSKADGSILKEIVREAESFLDSQLRAGLAADQRAMTFAGILGAVLSFSVAGTVTLLVNRFDLWPAGIPIGILVASLCVALFNAIYAARPIPFQYCGNDPKSFVVDIEKGKQIEVILAEQASFYSRDIKMNSTALDQNHSYLWRALMWALWGTIFSVMSVGILVLLRICSGAAL